MRRALWAVFLVSVSASCSGAAASPGREPTRPVAAARYEATIRWTSFGIPHIVARDLGSLAFGQGYAFARGHVCILADRVVMVRSERARFFGPGDRDENVDSDFGYLALGFRERAARAMKELSPEALALMRGFVAGYNHYLDEVGPSGLPAECRNAAWVRKLEDTDLLAYSMDVARLASGSAFVRLIGRSVPPDAHPAAPADGDESATLALPSVDRALASNGWAIGAERSETGRGMLVANPHFPWEGAHKFYEAHLTIPGQLDAYGVQLLGMPLLSIAFNQHLAWTHTFSASTQFTLYRIRLDAESPTRYRYGKSIREMTSREYTIEVLRPNGDLEKLTRTLYRSHYGPMLTAGSLRWDPAGGYAYTLRDAAEDTLHMADQYLAMLRATDLTSFRAALERFQSTPYMNTLYADEDGNTFYVDGSRVPNLSDAALIAWEVALKTMPAARAAWENGVPVLDGSLPLFEWKDEAGAGASGTVPFARAPTLTRRDYLFNANNSYWIVNLDRPLTGYSPFFGGEEKPLSPRSRMNLSILTDSRPDGYAGADGKLSAAELEQAATANESFMADLLLDGVVKRCEATAERWHARKRESEAEATARVDLASACATLRAWNGRFDLASVGAVLWREFLGGYAREDYYEGTQLAEPFDPRRPLDTPAGLPPAPSSGPDPVIEHLEQAIDRLRDAGIDPFRATLGEVQFTERAGKRIPVHGGGSVEGVTNLTAFDSERTTLLPHMEGGTVLDHRTGLSTRGYPVNYGTSFLLVVAFTDNGPRARAIMTYSASSDPASPHFADQTEMWSRKQLRPVLFTTPEIEADPQLEVQHVTAPEQRAP